MAKYINVNGIDIEIQKKKIKSLHLHVRPNGRVYVSAPNWTSEREIIRFVRANISWINAQLKKQEDRPGPDYYKNRKAELDKKIEILLPEWERITGLSCKSWHSRYMTSRWGSCIPSKGRLCFNLQLVDKPDGCLEYVILHELLHLIHPGHGADFKRDLDKYMPEWKTYSSLLK